MHKVLKNVKKTIRTIQGEAEYWWTEIEDKFGRWNQDYWTKEGFYVIHEGKYHHVYKVRR